MPASTDRLSRTLSPADQSVIIQQMHAQRLAENALRIQARAWPASVRRQLAHFVNANRTARLAIWSALSPAEEIVFSEPIRSNP